MGIEKEDSELIRQRLAKLAAITAEGIDAYGNKYEISSSIKELKDTVECSIADTGAGIPRDAIPAVFERAERPSAVPGQKARGGGLGLFLAKGIIESHNGKIWVESEIGKKTKFIFTLPRATS